MTDVSAQPSTNGVQFGIVGIADGLAAYGLSPLTARHELALEERGLEIELLARLGVGATASLGGTAIGIPFWEHGKLVGLKYRTLGDVKKFSQAKGSKQIFYNVDSLIDTTLAGEPVVICEGEMDCFAALQAGYSRALSVPGGAPAEQIKDKDGKKYSFVDMALPYLSEHQEIILATDEDGPGYNLRADLALRLGAGRCKFVNLPKGCKDLNDLLQLRGVEGIQEVIRRARKMAVHGYYELADLPELGTVEAHSTGIVGMDEHYKLRLGDFTVITGVPGHGKSSFINEICGRMAMKHGWKTVFASFEQVAQTDHRRALRTFHAEKLESMMGPHEKAAADAWINENFGFIIPTEDDEVTLEWMAKTSEQAILKREASILVWDPWNEIAHSRPPDMNVTEYTGFAIQRFKKLCKKYRVHGIIAAHPAKLIRGKDGKYPMPSLYDIADSAHWSNKPDVGIVVHRSSMSNNETTIRMAKVKFDTIGRPGELKASWNLHSSRYTIIEDDPEVTL